MTAEIGGSPTVLTLGQATQLDSGATLTVNSDGSFVYDASTSTGFAALEDGDSAADSFTYQVADGSGGTASAAVSLTVFGTPSTTVPADQSINQNASLVFSAANSDAIAVTNVDAASNEFDETVSVQNGTLTLVNGLGSVTFVNGTSNGSATIEFTGTVSQVNAALDSMTYQPASGFTGSDLLQISSVDATDGFAALDSVNVAVSIPSTTGVTADVSPSVYGQTVTFTATVAAASGFSGTPTGTVQFEIDGSDYGSPVTLNGSGQATITDSELSVGSHSVTAFYSGDGNFASSDDSGSPLSQTVGQDSTTTTLSSSASPALSGSSITFTATVAANSSGNIPTGTVEFWDGTTDLGPGTLSGGVATLTTSALSAGDHTISAIYSGDTNFVTSTSSDLNQAVDLASTTSLSSSLSSSVFGQSVTLIATVAPSVGSGTPTGTVDFYDGTTWIGSGTLSVVGGYDVATFSTSVLAAGDHPAITAVYEGDPTYYTSTSSASDVDVGQDGTTTSVGADTNPSAYGQTVTFTATVSAASPGSGTPTGTVQFQIDDSDYGSPVSLNGSGQATITDAALSLGDHTVTASYSGDSNFTASDPLDQTVDQATTSTVLTASANPALVSTSITFTAIVTANSPGSGTPTGSVEFWDGATDLGPGTLSGGVATYSTSALSLGDHTITAVYSGDTNFVTSTSSDLDELSFSRARQRSPLRPTHRCLGKR